MDQDKVKNFVIMYCSLILPAMLMIIAIVLSAGILWFFLLMIWICSGIMIVFLPTNPENVNR